MRTIWKFSIPNRHKTDVFSVPMPLGSLPLFFAKQDGALTLWAEVDSDQVVCDKTFLVVGTGYQIDVPSDSRRYVGTCFDGPFVWHLFEIVGSMLIRLTHTDTRS